MRAGVIVFPGSNCDRDLAVAFEAATGRPTTLIWHKDTELPQGLDIIAIPGGFSFGDYLRCGAIAARAPIMAAVTAFAGRGGAILGVCNGFQVLIEAGLLPGALMRNAGLRFVCKDVPLDVVSTKGPLMAPFTSGETVTFPVAHHDGNYTAPPETLKALEGEGRIAFRYRDNPNGSAGDIAGILSADGRILGLMPHPERAADPAHGGQDGARLFAGLVDQLQAV
ncbi:MAG: phosphoribosylformylglycinamidine synthase subunit PurQ [Pseudomonadota bacterium]